MPKHVPLRNYLPGSGDVPVYGWTRKKIKKPPRLSIFICVFLAFFCALSPLFFHSLAFPVRADSTWPPDAAYVNGVVGHAQQRNLSCESRSASDFAAFFGVNASEADILAALPSSDNPNYGFVGSPDGEWGHIPPNSYGVHANPIEDALNGFGLPVYGERNLTWDFVRSEIAVGRPVIVWIIGAMWNGEPIEYIDSQGRTAIVAHYEHTMILIGYDPTTVWAVDAYDGQTRAFARSSFLTSWAVLGNMGVYYRVTYTDTLYLPLLTRSDTSAQSAASPLPDVPAAATYLVQSGDSLRTIADQLNTTWEQLAEINGLSAPYVVYPGQELRLTP